MAFKAMFLAHAPDADPSRHTSVIDTGLYKLYSVVVKDHQQALETCRRMVREEGIHSIILCPGNTNRDVAEIGEAVGSGVSVSVARGDNPGMRLAAGVMEREGWFNRPR